MAGRFQINTILFELGLDINQSKYEAFSVSLSVVVISRHSRHWYVLGLNGPLERINFNIPRQNGHMRNSESSPVAFSRSRTDALQQ
jgi:hypothetical protein